MTNLGSRWFRLMAAPLLVVFAMTVYFLVILQETSLINFMSKSMTTQSCECFENLNAGNFIVSVQEPAKHLPGLVCVGGPSAGTGTFGDLLFSNPTFLHGPTGNEYHFWKNCERKLNDQIHFDFEDVQGSIRHCQKQRCYNMTWANTSKSGSCSKKEYLRPWQEMIDADPAQKDAFWSEKSPSYERSPHVAQVFARDFPDTKLVLFMRNPLTRIVSMVRNLWWHETESEAAEYLNRILTSSQENAVFQNMYDSCSPYEHEARQFIPQAEIQSDMAFVVALKYGAQRNFKEEQIFSYWICPYFSLLFWINELKKYDRLEDLWVIQSESFFTHEIEAMRNMTCWVKFGKIDDFCQHGVPIMSRLESQHSHDHSAKYGFKSQVSKKAFKLGATFFRACSAKLDTLLKMHPQIVKGEFDVSIWKDAWAQV